MIVVTDHGRVRIVTLTREQQLNALCSELIDELLDIVARTQRDDAVGCLVLRGAGGRAFCAGADLGEILGADHERARSFIDRGQRLMVAVEESDVPVLAAVDGWALGGGMELALACHVVVASTRSRFGLPESKIGCMPGFGGTQRLFAALPRPLAMRLLLEGDPLTATEAHAHGLLAGEPVEPDRFAESALSLATRIAGGSRTGQARILRAARPPTRPPALALEAALAAEAISSADGQEGIRAFAEKRPPRFQRRASE